MRRHKFRVWDKEKKKMIYSDEFKGVMTLDGSIWYFDKASNMCFDYLDRKKDEPQQERYLPLQFTGFKDKNNKEIYEGDVVKCGECQGVVEFKGIKWEPFDYISGLDYAHGVRPRYTEDGTEVIGNIHDNPELIK